MALLRLDQLLLPTGGQVSLDIAASECVCLSGPSGVGKTLFLRAVADLDPHPVGIYLEHLRQEEIPPTQWRRQVAYLAAESRWWAETVSEHFPTPLTPAQMEELSLPAESLRWPVNRLSSGERQRLALLRLLWVNQPRVLLLDEPTANLDPAATLLVEALVGRYQQAQAAAVLWVSHDPLQIQRVSSRHWLMSSQGIFENTP